MNSARGFRNADTEPWGCRSAAGKLASTFGGRAFRPKSRRKMHVCRTGGQNGGQSPESPDPPEMHFCAILVRLVLMMLILAPADDGQLTARRGRLTHSSRGDARPTLLCSPAAAHQMPNPGSAALRAFFLVLSCLSFPSFWAGEHAS